MSKTKRKIVVVGGVAGGASAAAKARRTDELAEIVMLEKGPYVSFANCGLPYHVSGEIEKREQLFVVTPERLRERFKIDLRVRSEALSIDREGRTVRVLDRERGREYEESYDKLILSPGADPIVPKIPGADATGVFTLKTIPDMDAILAYLEKEKPPSAVVIGGGFIGLETAEALRVRGLEVTLVEAAPQILLPWDPEMADIVERHMLDVLWIEVGKGDKVVEVLTEKGKTRGVKLESGREVEGGLVILSIGVSPNSGLAREAGLELGLRGAIVTDKRMRTSDPDIYAVGDVVQSVNRVTGRPCWLPMAGPANRQGRVAGANAAGGNETFPGVVGASIVRVGKVAAARTGLSEREAREAGFDFLASHTHYKHHAGYYPGARDLSLKLIVEKGSGRLLGAQVVGRAGADKRIDVLTTAVIAGLSVRDIEDLELAYSPPFGSAKDPVNMAAMVARNRLEGVEDFVTWDEHFKEDPPPRVLDIRSPEERKTVYVQGTEQICIDDIRDRLGEMDPEEPLRVHCRVGQRGYFAQRILKGRGFKNVKNISGGWMSIWGEEREEKLIGQEPEPKE